MISQLKSLLKKRLVSKYGIPEIPASLDRLAASGFRPQLVFDVGAYHGEFSLLCRRLWPEAFIACFEPQARARAVLENQIDNQMRIYSPLLGAAPREDVVFHEVETASSVLAEHANKNHAVARHPMTTIDLVCAADFRDQAIDLLKLDVQGYELEVLKGAEHSLRHVKLILAEVNLLDIHENVPLLAELVGWLAERGFVAYDICGLTRRPLDKALWQADFIFVPLDSPLRSDKRWSQ
jgi:FkbM family methyltransferase